MCLASCREVFWFGIRLHLFLVVSTLLTLEKRGVCAVCFS